HVWVRVNGLDSGLATDDLDAVAGIAGLAGIFLPKVETPDEVRRWDALIDAHEKGHGVEAGAIKLVLSIESALGVLNAHAMATTVDGRMIDAAMANAARRALEAEAVWRKTA